MRSRVARGVALGAAAVVLTASCAAQPDGGWAQVTQHHETADFALPDVVLDQLVDDADVTVVGELGEVLGERPLAADAAYVQIELVVLDVIAGDVAPGDVLVFEGWTSEVTAVPEGEMLLFLTEKDSAVDPPGLWVWHTSRGIWAATERAAIDTPLADEPPASSPLYADDLAGLSSLPEVADLVRELAED